ncbi:SDR family NAD(P)-dependent oxidoreductase [Cohnella lubricantis]|uniref:SDR family NAD(P)-dependent oxidoreductase n=1 Tax=Cohnella lubricantis TaxID=2163172 RepID=A0A841TIL6_9BACL|nr:SDR family NAD(P)-dependent oxidoreductase [Cohnella lubricantis]MBB6679088.1 SDR family NAD(P)-dependent oxidoreductase [Cohnella lubricantis]MBP2118543.1 short-subunit dehydrogenase [Cohnella lubricantis]
MRVSLEGRVVLVTGASSGVGAETAKLLSARGAIPILAARSEDKLRTVSKTIRGEHEAIVMDVTDEASVRSAFRSAIDKYGRIDVLVNNAGFGEFVAFPDASLSHFQEMIDVNYLGAVRCVQEAYPLMRAAGSGHIVNVVSIAGKLATAKATAYAASKHALLGFTNALRQDCKGTGIRVSAVNPGPIDTPFFDRADPSGTYTRNLGSFMLRPEQVAREIVRTIETGRPEKDMPFISGAGAKLFQLFPRMADRLLSGLLNKK